MLSNGVYDDVITLINENDFFTKQHQAIYSALALSRNNKPFWFACVAYLSIRSVSWNLQVSVLILTELVKIRQDPLISCIASQLVRDKGILRGLIQASNDVSKVLTFHRVVMFEKSLVMKLR